MEAPQGLAVLVLGAALALAVAVGAYLRSRRRATSRRARMLAAIEALPDVVGDEATGWRLQRRGVTCSIGWMTHALDLWFLPSDHRAELDGYASWRRSEETDTFEPDDPDDELVVRCAPLVHRLPQELLAEVVVSPPRATITLLAAAFDQEPHEVGSLLAATIERGFELQAVAQRGA